MSTTASTLIPARMKSGDLARVASVGLRTRRLRAALSALGIAIGVAAIVAVLGLSSSSSAGLQAEIAQLGTNLLTVTQGQTFTGQTAPLPLAAPSMISRIEPVQQVADAGTISDVNAFRSPLVPSIDTNEITVDAASLNLLPVTKTTIAHGSYLNAATATEPVAVLGAAAAQRLGIDRVYPGERIWVGGKWFYVRGILNPSVLAPAIDTSVLVGYVAAQRYLGYNTVAQGKTTIGPPSTIYVRAATSQVNFVWSVLAQTANPEDPNAVNVSQPSSALTAQAEAKSAFNGLFLGLGAVALLVGAVGVANIMIISVLERRSEIGLRRALGATRGQIRIQFLSEAVLLALIGGAVGVAAGALATVVYASAKHETAVIPAEAWAGGIAAAVAIGAIAGLLPAIRAARLSPTEALRTV
jgi:putative ABC transport system permease protein